MKRIKVISIENTTFCAANCVMCPREKFRHRLENMSFDLFKKSVDEAISCGVECIQICGFGDPAIDPNFIEEMKYVKGKYPHIRLGTTNTCHMIKGAVLDAVCEYMDEIVISMYGMTKASYEKIHGGALKFEEVRQNIDILLTREKRPHAVIDFLLMPENENELEEWRAYYEPKADRCDVWRLQNWAGYLYNQDREKPFRECFRINSLNGMFIRTDGSVSICCMDYNRDLVMGNIRQQSLKDIIAGKSIKYLQDINHKGGGIESHPICGNCDQIHDRSDALVYSTDSNMRPGKHPLFDDEDIYV